MKDPTPKWVKGAFALRRNGWTYKRIAEVMGVTKQAVHYHLTAGYLKNRIENQTKRQAEKTRAKWREQGRKRRAKQKGEEVYEPDRT
jgi:predicted transcriptional regulator